MRKIECYKCGKYLGEIRDATLHKTLYFWCGCADRRPKTDYSDIFGGKNGDIFGDLFKGKF